VLWVLFMVALWALIIMAVLWLARTLMGRRSMTAHRGAMTMPGGPPMWRGGGAGTASAEQILAERYAHGQIDENEYRTRLGVLRGDQAAATSPPAPEPSEPPPPAAPPPSD